MTSPEERHSMGFSLENFISVHTWTGIGREITSLVGDKDNSGDDGVPRFGEREVLTFALSDLSLSEARGFPIFRPWMVSEILSSYWDT